MLIGILKAGHVAAPIAASHGGYDAMFARLLDGRGLSFRTWDVVDMDFPEHARAADGWLVTGSRHGAYEDLPFIAPLEAFLRTAFDAAVPIVGICFGHQILAQALGGRVEKWQGGWTVGATVYDWAGTRRIVNAWHQDQITAAPEAAEVIATAPGCAFAGLRYGDRALTFQGHPEFDEDVIAGLIAYRSASVPSDRVEAARAALGQPTDREALAGEIADFFKGAPA